MRRCRAAGIHQPVALDKTPTQHPDVEECKGWRSCHLPPPTSLPWDVGISRMVPYKPKHHAYVYSKLPKLPAVPRPYGSTGKSRGKPEGTPDRHFNLALLCSKN